MNILKPLFFALFTGISSVASAEDAQTGCLFTNDRESYQAQMAPLLVGDWHVESTGGMMIVGGQFEEQAPFSSTRVTITQGAGGGLALSGVPDDRSFDMEWQDEPLDLWRSRAELRREAVTLNQVSDLAGCSGRAALMIKASGQYEDPTFDNPEARFEIHFFVISSDYLIGTYHSRLIAGVGEVVRQVTLTR